MKPLRMHQPPHPGEILRQLAFNRCGPSYATNDNNQLFQRRPGGLLGALFGGPQLRTYDDESFMPDTQVGTYRTLCVRTCDGYYFPISFSTVPAKFNDDAATCQSMCPGAEAVLYTYRNPGEDINQAVLISGQPYSSSPNAFHYRQEFNPSCSCKPAGETWSQALKGLDDKAAAEQQGDIIVTEEGAKKMAQPRGSSPAKKGTAPASAAAAPASTPDASPAVTPDKDNKTIRTVGPTFIPAR